MNIQHSNKKIVPDPEGISVHHRLGSIIICSILYEDDIQSNALRVIQHQADILTHNFEHIIFY